MNNSVLSPELNENRFRIKEGKYTPNVWKLVFHLGYIESYKSYLDSSLKLKVQMLLLYFSR